MRLPDRSPILDKNCAPMAPDILSSAGAGVWRKAPMALPDSDFRERPPGLIQHVLTVLVFWSWVLLLPRLPPSSRSLRLFLCASICFMVSWTFAWICCPQLPFHPCKNRTHSTCFYSTGGHTPTFHCLRLFGQTRVYPYPLGAGSARPNPKMGAPDPENPLFPGFFLCSEGD